jgi:hypothetical protein
LAILPFKKEGDSFSARLCRLSMIGKEFFMGVYLKFKDKNGRPYGPWFIK